MSIKRLLTAFAAGADGVLVAGSHPGDCHCPKGNFKTVRRFMLLNKLLGQTGSEDERFRLEWISASEGARCARWSMT